MENIILIYYYHESQKKKNRKKWKSGTSTKQVMYAWLGFSLLYLDVLTLSKSML